MSVVDAALGAAFQALFEELRCAIKKSRTFKKKLKNMEEKLHAMEPRIMEIAKLNNGLDIAGNSKKFMEVLKDGEILVKKLSRDVEKNRWWRFSLDVDKLARFGSSVKDQIDILQLETRIIAGKTLELLTASEENPRQVAGSVIGRGGGCCEAPGPAEFTVGLDFSVAELRAEILSEERAVIVVTAQAGCGKTTLVLKLCQDGEIKDRFKGNILFVKVSKTPNLTVIVEEIYQHYRGKVPSFCDEESAIQSLERLLREMGNSSPVLLVLDDVWSDSESFVDNFCFNSIPGYKMLVTTRFEFRKFKPAYELKMLSDEDSMALFRHHAQLGDTSNIRETIVTEVVQHCKRWPLALKLTGSTLCGEPPRIWQTELKRLETRNSNVLDLNNDLLLCLRTSVELLGEKAPELKECFVDLGAFPEDRKIPVSALLDMWATLYGIEEDEALNKLLRLHKLKMANIFVTRSDVHEVDDYYSDHFITLHDLIRELAIHQSKQDCGRAKRLFFENLGNSLVNSSSSRNMESLNPHLLSISTDGPVSPHYFDAPLMETEVLVLNFLKSDQTLPEVTQKMINLKVLIATNYGSFLAELRNLNLLGSLINLNKIRLERVSVPSFASIRLENLQKLSFFMCKIGQAFNSIAIAECFPNVEELNIDYCSDLVNLPDGICDLVKIRKLSVTHCTNLSPLPEELGKMRNVKVLRLRSCTDLTELPRSICELAELEFLDISNCFSIRSLPEGMGELRSLAKLNMKECSRLTELPSSIVDLEKLKEVVCDEEIKELWEQYLPADSDLEFTLTKEDVNLNFLA